SNGVVDMLFGPFSKTAGANPVWNGTTCANVYCHGSFAGGGKNEAPQRGKPGAGTGGSRAPLPPPPPPPPHPPAPGPPRPGHGAGYSQTAKTVNKATHIDGIVESNSSSQTCSSCHGDGMRTGITGADPELKASPPLGTHGETLTSTLAVGVHQAHLNTGTFS